MTLPATARRAGPFNGNGSTTAFPFTFKVFAAADVQVVKTTSAGDTILVLNSDYSVSLNSDQDANPGGTITFPISGSALASGQSLTFTGDLDYDQPLDLPSGGNFSPIALENQLDRTTMQLQQLKEELDRALTLPVSSTASTSLPSPSALKVIGWDGAASSLTNYDPADFFTAAVYSNWVFDTFTGNGATTSFALQKPPGNVANMDVSLGGVTQVPGTDYSLSGSTLTFTTAPANGVKILARYGQAVQQGSTTFATEIKTATAGQTVFVLTSTTYTPGANTISVYVNGLRLTPGTDFLETSGNVVTMTSGLALNDEVVFVCGTTVNASIAASSVGFTPSGTGAIATNVQTKLRESVSVKDFGAVGDGVTDDYAAFQAAIESLSASSSYVGGEIIIPSGTYYLSQTWKIRKRVTIQGTNAGDQPQTAACTLLFPINTDGIRFYSNIDSSTGTDGTMSVLRNVQVRAAAKGASGIGIKSTTSIRIEHCIVRDFKSHGIEIHGQTGTGATGVADFWNISNVRVVTCGGHGLYTHGNDSQVGVASQLECVANGGWGFYDESPYTNTYIACQAAGNTTGSFYHANTMSYQGGIYVGCYVEYDAGATVSLTEGCLVIGGTLNSNTATAFYNGSPGGSGINVPTGGQWMGWRNGTEVWRIGTDNRFSGLPRATFGTAADYNDIFNSNIAQVTSTAANQNRITFDTPSGRAGSIQTTGATTAYITTSDYRMKENVQPIVGGLAKILQLNPVTYTWKSDKRSGQGFIAHELQAVVPECVSGWKDAVDENGKPIYQGVDTSFLMATLVKAVQESAARIELLEAQVAQLNAVKTVQ